MSFIVLLFVYLCLCDTSIKLCNKCKATVVFELGEHYCQTFRVCLTFVNVKYKTLSLLLSLTEFSNITMIICDSQIEVQICIIIVFNYSSNLLFDPLRVPLTYISLYILFRKRNTKK